MKIPIRRAAVLASLAAAAFLAGSQAVAQTACRTASCSPDTAPPVECEQMASARIIQVSMQGANPVFVFSPSEPLVEPGACISWIANTSQHSGSDTSCPDGNFCNNPSPAACLFETGNVGTADPAVLCFYNTTDWPAQTDDPFYCRIHATPTTGTMRGTLRVTTPIDLQVDKITATGDVSLTWTGGGVAGSERFIGARADAATFPTFGSFDPDSGPTGRSYLDLDELDPALPSRYYLVRNRQSNEP